MDISKRARYSETGTTLQEYFLHAVYENLNSSPLNGKQRLKRARNHQHVLRNSCTLLVAITKRGKGKGGYNESHGGTALYLESASMACSQNYQLPFMIIYCTAPLIMEGAKWGCFVFFSFFFFLSNCKNVFNPQRAI